MSCLAASTLNLQIKPTTMTATRPNRKLQSQKITGSKHMVCYSPYRFKKILKLSSIFIAFYDPMLKFGIFRQLSHMAIRPHQYTNIFFYIQKKQKSLSCLFGSFTYLLFPCSFDNPLRMSSSFTISFIHSLSNLFIPSMFN